MIKIEDYDYYAILLTDSKGVRHVSPLNFQKGIPPEPYCEELLKNSFRCENTSAVMQYVSYEIRKLTL